MVDETGKEQVPLGAKVSQVTGRQKRHNVLPLSLFILKKDNVCDAHWLHVAAPQ